MNYRILYLPIIDPGAYHDIALANKRGLLMALRAVGEVRMMDYLSLPQGQLFDHLALAVEDFQPALILTQFQGPDRITPDQLRTIRSYGAPIVNFNGDYWPHSLVSVEMLALLKEIDLQLVVNAAVLKIYAANGIPAAFWPFGVEEPNRPLPDVPTYDVVFLGNNYSDKRQQLYAVLRGLPCSVGIYGTGWPQAEGECNYDFAYGMALYSRAKIAISDNQFPDAEGYLSDRPYQAMAAGCCVLQQEVAFLNLWTGFVKNRHYVGFRSLTEIPSRVKELLKTDRLRRWFADNGREFVLSHHTFDQRVKELLALLPPVPVGPSQEGVA